MVVGYECRISILTLNLESVEYYSDYFLWFERGHPELLPVLGCS